MQRIAAPAIVAASGCAPPIPPSPAVRIVRPAEVGRAEMLLARGGERLVRPLQDSLRADVDPAARGHLAEHRQAQRLEPAELVPRRPAGHEQRVRDQHARRPVVRPEDADRLAALDEQRLVVAELEQRADDCAQRLVVARGLARSRRRRRAPPGARRPRRRGCSAASAAAPRSTRIAFSSVPRGADAREVAAERLDGLREAVDRRHECCCSRSMRRERRHQLQAVASSEEEPAATGTATSMFPPVANAMTTKTTANDP